MIRPVEEYATRPDCQISTPEKPFGHFEKTHPNDWFFTLSIRCQESVILVQIDQQKKRFQSDQFPFFALKFGGFPLVLLLAAYVHLYVVQIVYFLDIGFLFYRNGMDFSTLN